MRAPAATVTTTTSASFVCCFLVVVFGAGASDSKLQDPVRAEAFNVSAAAPRSQKGSVRVAISDRPLSPIPTVALFYGALYRCCLQCGSAQPAYASVLDLDLSPRMSSSSIDNPARKDPVSLGLPILPYVWLNQSIPVLGGPTAQPYCRCQ